MGEREGGEGGREEGEREREREEGEREREREEGEGGGRGREVVSIQQFHVASAVLPHTLLMRLTALLCTSGSAMEFSAMISRRYDHGLIPWSSATISTASLNNRGVDGRPLGE